MRFTPTEIRLCKKIKQKHRKLIDYGDWYYTTEYPEEEYRMRIYKYKWTSASDRKINTRKNIIPLWTISDCLKWLHQLKSFRCYFIDHTEIETRTVCMNYWNKQEKVIIKKSKTLLGALLRTILVVLEEKP